MTLREISRLLYQLKIANQEMTSRFEKETGFSLTRYELMMSLKEMGSCSQSQIQTELRIDSAAITRHLKILEEKGFVVRERNKENNREIFVEITKKARTALDQCAVDHDETQNSLTMPLKKDEEQQLLYLLNKLI